jgi:hypothetical protein
MEMGPSSIPIYDSWKKCPSISTSFMLQEENVPHVYLIGLKLCRSPFSWEIFHFYKSDVLSSITSENQYWVILPFLWTFKSSMEQYNTASSRRVHPITFNLIVVSLSNSVRRFFRLILYRKAFKFRSKFFLFQIS